LRGYTQHTEGYRVVYTALTPHNTCVVIRVRWLARALELAALDLARAWTLAHIRIGERRLDIDAIPALLNARRVQAA
jgi:hypothetical protein